MALGRPRDFCTEAALDKALKLFWRKGYEGTSLTDLTREMGISRPSLYAAFGNKESLFRKALDRYTEQKSALIQDAQNEPTVYAGVKKLLYNLIGNDDEECRGCMAVMAALVCGEESESIKNELASYRTSCEADFCASLEKAKAEGELAPDANPADLAHFVYTLAHGIAVQSAGGANRDQLKRVVDMAMRAWPSA